MHKKNKKTKRKFEPQITRIKLDPEQAVLQCNYKPWNPTVECTACADDIGGS